MTDNLVDYLKDNLERNLSGSYTEERFSGALGKTFPAFIISDVQNSVSTAAMRRLHQSIIDTKSHMMPLLVLPATTPQTLERDLSLFGMNKSHWSYPTTPREQKLDIKSGLTLTGYNAKNLNKVIACMVSHMRIWHMAATYSSPTFVFEHDAVLTRQIKFNDFPNSGGGIIGLNDPRGATRKSSVYYTKVIEQKSGVLKGYEHVKEAPWVDRDRVAPQGIAGNSAYLIYPEAAGHMLNLVKRYGLWPNDALMCKQLVPFLRQTYPFYTTLQGVTSTTQG